MTDGSVVMPAPDYWAHSENKHGRPETVREHLAAVCDRAVRYSTSLSLDESAQAASLLHDLGKYGIRFQDRVRGKEQGIDHWTAGAAACLDRYGEAGLTVALAIEGHHTGLSSPGSLGNRLRELRSNKRQDGIRFSQITHDLPMLLKEFGRDGFVLPHALPAKLDTKHYGAFQLDGRMLFSTLVDADFVSTEAHFEARTPEELGRDSAPALRPQQLLAVLTRETAARANRAAAEQVQQLRADLHAVCATAAKQDTGLFTLTAPTGSGKTLSMLRFALEHAVAHQEKIARIIVVLPYLSILDQTAREYRELVERAFPGEADRYLLEHHSMADGRFEDGMESEGARQRRFLAENWDAPLVLTTNVQFLESLHANRPGACRKLHRLANAVVLMDEVQTIPQGLAVLTLATISRLSERFGSTVVMATATQPAFGSLDGAVRKLSPKGWQAKEIAPPSLGLFGRIQRTKVEWPRTPDEFMSWEEIAAALRADRRTQALCIVNLKAHAHELLRLLEGVEGAVHLSTSLCAQHREAVLATVRQNLSASAPCRLISTQCVEAGVDLDFPEVWRAMGPLEAIAQAAGRCNRHGLRPGQGTVRVFRPKTLQGRSYPDAAYQQAALLTEKLLRELGPDALDIDRPELYERYYRELYLLRSLDREDSDLQDAVARRDFARVAALYRLIPGDTISVVVPYDVETYEELAMQARNEGLDREWIRRARPLSVNLFRPREGDAAWHHLEPVRLKRVRTKRGEEATDWMLLRNPEHYRKDVGLALPKEMEMLHVG